MARPLKIQRHLGTIFILIVFKSWQTDGARIPDPITDESKEIENTDVPEEHAETDQTQEPAGTAKIELPEENEEANQTEEPEESETTKLPDIMKDSENNANKPGENETTEAPEQHEATVEPEKSTKANLTNEPSTRRPSINLTTFVFKCPNGEVYDKALDRCVTSVAIN